MTYILWKLLLHNQPAMSWQQSRRVHCFFSQFRSCFLGKSARTVQRPKGGVHQHLENKQEMAWRKNTVPDDYAVSDRL